MAKNISRSMAEKYAEKARLLKDTEKELEIQKWGLRKTNEAIKFLYKELAEKNKKLQELDRLKSDFVAMVSHELQSPLSIIKGYTSLLLDEIPGKLTSGQKEYEDLVLNNINRLSRLISDLLDIAKIESRKMDLHKRRTDIIDLAKGVASYFKVAADRKNIELRTKFPSARLSIQADSDKIIQIFTNLIDNAIRFTPKNGRITVGIADKKREIECSVADTGVGIATEDLGKVFKRFQQFHRSEAPGSQGTGLGLAISKELVLLHGGNIRVDSEPGEGTVFTFTLPKAI